VSLQILADAIKIQAEATIKISDAIDRMSRNNERQTQLLKMIFQLLKK